MSVADIESRPPCAEGVGRPLAAVGFLAFLVLFSCAIADDDDADDDTLVAKPQRAAQACDVLDECHAYSDTLACRFMVTAPFDTMDGTLLDWCEFCGVRFAHCVLAYRGECDGPFTLPDCGGVANCVLKCRWLCDDRPNEVANDRP